MASRFHVWTLSGSTRVLSKDGSQKKKNLLGGIGVGRFADLAVLSKNVFDEREVSDEDIRTMTSILTIVGGRIVYDAGLLSLP